MADETDREAYATKQREVWTLRLETERKVLEAMLAQVPKASVGELTAVLTALRGESPGNPR